MQHHDGQLTLGVLEVVEVGHDEVMLQSVEDLHLLLGHFGVRDAEEPLRLHGNFVSSPPPSSVLLLLMVSFASLTLRSPMFTWFVLLHSWEADDVMETPGRLKTVVPG